MFGCWGVGVYLSNGRAEIRRLKSSSSSYARFLCALVVRFMSAPQPHGGVVSFVLPLPSLPPFPLSQWRLSAFVCQVYCSAALARIKSIIY